MPMNRLLTTLAILLFCIHAKPQYDIRHYSVADGLSQNTVMSIMQDRDGYMWFGTWDGLNKFDAYSFTTYKSHPDKPDFRNNRVELIREDSLGYIWFLTYDGKFHRFDKATESFLTLPYNFTLNRYNADHMLTEPYVGCMYIVAEEGVVRIAEKEDEPTDTRLFGYKNGASAHFLTADGKGAVWYDDGACLCSIAGKDTTAVMLALPTAESQTTLTTAMLRNDGVWVASADGKLWRKPLTGNNAEPINLSTNDAVSALLPLSQYEIMIATEDNGLYIYNILSGKLKQAADGRHTGKILSLTNDSHGIVWIETDKEGVWRYRLSDNSLKHLTQQIDRRYGPLPANRLVMEDAEHNIWVNPTGGGLSRYNRMTDELENPINGITNMIHTAYTDRQGNIWLSTYDTGVDCLSMQQQQFILHDMHQTDADIGEIRAMAQLADGSILLSSKDQRLCRLNGTTVALPANTKEDITVYSILQQSDGSILLGARHKGLFRLTDNALQPMGVAADGSRLTGNAVYDLTQTANGDIYAATYGGGVNIIEEGTIISSANGWEDYPIASCSRVRCLLNTGDTMLWAGTTNGLLQVRLRDRKTWFTPYCDVHCLMQDSHGNIWMGTFSGGLNKIVRPANDSLPAQFMTYTVKNGLRSDIVLSMAEDASGRIWFTSENTITRFDPVTGEFQHFYPFANSHTKCFTECKALRLNSGDILFGYSNGYCSFTPERILRLEDVPPLHFTGFQLFNTDAAIGEEKSPLKKSIGQTKEITLKHIQSVWSIEYAALDFEDADKIEYAFMLDGFEKDWNYVHKQRKATYTNLPAGRYVFRVKSTNAEGVWVDNERTLRVHILPSFWHTGWAMLLYVLIAALILAIAYLIVSRYNRLQQQMQVEQQVTDFRLRFFTNISHELRTPLTLISGPVDNILKTEKLPQTARTQLEIVESNARRMLRLINEILDFRKIQNRKMRLKIQETHLGALVQDTCSNFNKEAFDKRINFRIENTAENDTVFCDREKVDIILYNLLSNAFKFTPAGKNITVSITDKPSFVLMKVEDEGVGIPHEKRNILFERFSSHNEIENLAGKAGTGIGLNLVKELVDLHKGYIEVESESGKGATFTVMFRKGKEHFGNEVDFMLSGDLLPHTQDPMQPKLDSVVIRQNLPHILIVEDNDDMCSFLRNIFSTQFDTETAKDGEEGLKKVRELMPDIVITDLMMPNMDGLEMTNHIKKELATSHIPVILLTAKDTIESRLEAMRYGADDYITKPFSAEYLKARVDNLLQQRERLRERYRNDLLTLQTSPLAKEKSPDEVFLAKLLNFMEKNMDNNELIVEDMVSEMAMGRTVFFNKLKNLTGLSPVEFIREVRIKRAAQLLQTGSYNVTEVTYMVGMNDSRYFSKCFKAVYGMTPTEYKKKKTD